MKLSNMIARTLAMLAGVSAALAAAPPPGPDRPPRVPHGFQAVVGTAAEPYGKTNWAKEIVEPQSKIELVFIPAGEFTMGSDANERWQTIPRPAHRVRISRPFYFGKYTVTQKQWKAVFGGDAGTIAIGYPDWTGDHYEKKGNIALSVAEPWRNFKGVGKSGEFPACAVPWILAVKYCQALSKLAGGTAVRLPTEAEFEYALRAGTTTRFFWGDDESKVDEYAWVGPWARAASPAEWDRRSPTPGACTTSTATSGNGVPTGAARNTTKSAPRSIPRGRNAAIGAAAKPVAAERPATPAPTAGLRIARAICPTSG